MIKIHTKRSMYLFKIATTIFFLIIFKRNVATDTSISILYAFYFLIKIINCKLFL